MAAALLETSRLELRRLSEDDAPFMLELLNEPSFIRNIGDRGVRTIDEARGYIVRARSPATRASASGCTWWS